MNSFDPKNYWEERLEKSFGLHGVGSYGLGASYNKWLYRVRRRIFLRAVSGLNLNAENAQVADIGSGTGFYIDCWKEAGFQRVVGSDITNVSVENLSRKFPSSRFYLTDIGDEVVNISGAGCYKAVSAFDVLFHIVDDGRYRTAIRNIHSLLCPEGWFIFSDNFLHRETERIRHQASRSLKEIISSLEDAGFVIVKRIPMFVLMNDPVDSSHRSVRKLWSTLMNPVLTFPPLGHILGAVLYPIELLLTRYVKEGPSTEIMICRKRKLT